MGWKGKCVFQVTATKTTHAKVLVPMCVRAQSNTCVCVKAEVRCVHMAVPVCHVDPVGLCVRGSMSKRGGSTHACRSRSMIGVHVSNTHLHR